MDGFIGLIHFIGVDWGSKFIDISNSIRELKYLSTLETDQLVPVFLCMSHDSHISSFQFEHEGHTSEKLRRHEICNASIHSSIGVIVIYLTKVILIKGKVVNFIVCFRSQ